MTHGAVAPLTANSSSDTAAPSALRASITAVQAAAESSIVCSGLVGEGTESVRVVSVDEVRMRVVAATEGGRDRTEAILKSVNINSSGFRTEQVVLTLFSSSTNQIRYSITSNCSHILDSNFLGDSTSRS